MKVVQELYVQHDNHFQFSVVKRVIFIYHKAIIKNSIHSLITI